LLVEAQLKPQEVQARVSQALTQNLPNQDDMASKEFDRRVKVAELMLKEADIKNKSKIVEMQMADKFNAQANTEMDFLNKLGEGLKSNG
jgi:predicted alpha/beta-hydrolase family hydrolase